MSNRIEKIKDYKDFKVVRNIKGIINFKKLSCENLFCNNSATGIYRISANYNTLDVGYCSDCSKYISKIFKEYPHNLDFFRDLVIEAKKNIILLSKRNQLQEQHIDNGINLVRPSIDRIDLSLENNDSFDFNQILNNMSNIQT